MGNSMTKAESIKPEDDANEISKESQIKARAFLALIDCGKLTRAKTDRIVELLKECGYMLEPIDDEKIKLEHDDEKTVDKDKLIDEMLKIVLA